VAPPPRRSPALDGGVEAVLPLARLRRLASDHGTPAAPVPRRDRARAGTVRRSSRRPVGALRPPGAREEVGSTAANASAAGNDTCSATSTASRSRSASPAPTTRLARRLDLARNGAPAARTACQGVRRRRYTGLVRRAGEELDVTINIRRRPAETHWFVPLQPLWRVERTFAWLGRNRRLRHDHEATVTSSQTFAHAAAVAFMLNRLYPNRQAVSPGQRFIYGFSPRACRATTG